MSLHVESYGAGPPVVLVHGWGLHGGIFAPLIAPLAQRYRVLVPDLPGFGFSRGEPVPSSLDEIVDRVRDAVDSPAVWLGWSLGGLVTMAAAARTGLVSRLILVSATPRFVRTDDWPHGLHADILAQFAQELATDYRATLTRFLSLQVGPGERDTLRALRDAVLARGEPAMAALRLGLALLAESDMRDSLASLDMPVQILHGARDKLVPIGAGHYLAATLPQARLHEIEHAGHAPFISHTDACLRALEGFLDG